MRQLPRRNNQLAGESLLHSKDHSLLRSDANCGRAQLDGDEHTVNAHLNRFDGIFHLEQSSFGRVCAHTVIVFSSRGM